MKYVKLAEHMSRRGREKEVTLAFGEIERIIGSKLPRSAYVHDTWWNNNPHHSWSDGWIQAGWRKITVDLKSQTVTFVKNDPSEVARRHLKPLGVKHLRPLVSGNNASSSKVVEQSRVPSTKGKGLREELFYKATERFQLDKHSEKDVDAIVSLMEWAYERGRLDEALEWRIPVSRPTEDQSD